MNISVENDIKNSTSTISMTLYKEDYQEAVSKVLQSYRRQSNVPGFRKGHLPINIIEKKYGKHALIEEVNKILSVELDKYIKENNIDVLGNPILLEDNINWDSDILDFRFEIASVPGFELVMPKDGKITNYKIKVSEEDIDKRIEEIALMYGKGQPTKEINNKTIVKGIISWNTDKNHSVESTIFMSNLIEKRIKDFEGAKVGALIHLETENLFKNENHLAIALNKKNEEIDDIIDDISTISLEIKELLIHQPAEIDKDLLEKIYPDKSVSDIEGLKNKVIEEFENYYKTTSDIYLFNQVIEYITESTKISLPKDFLIRSLKSNTSDDLTEEEMLSLYEREKISIKNNLIFDAIAKKYDINVSINEVKDHFKDNILKIMGGDLADDQNNQDMIENMIKRIMEDQEKVNSVSIKIFNEKLLTSFNENLKFKESSLEYKDFVEKVKK
ncbi:trigger factor [Ichthyobacterium seriolicida]|uniref:Cell division trigger factor n=1 Tax=Ichthyobacterium seriolicida TaxID=242600 RepID=A0A1J1DXQ1_9FLAO|nr:trigger factor [Ichthyobacterium seriolicida]BAV94642.1 cell division trigger factor [Ichthyobacterium seriolicida]